MMARRADPNGPLLDERGGHPSDATDLEPRRSDRPARASWARGKGSHGMVVARLLVMAVVSGVLAPGVVSPLRAAQPASSVAPELWLAAGVARVTPPIEAPEFMLHDLAGKPVRLADFRGRLVLLYFWATW